MEHISNASTTGGLPLDASLAPAWESVREPLVNGRVVYIAGLSIGIAIIASERDGKIADFGGVGHWRAQKA